MIVIAILIIGLTCLVIIGLFRQPLIKTAYINPNVSSTRPMCMDKPIECNTDNDCRQCNDAITMKCIEMKRSPDQRKAYGNIHNKYCLPEKPNKPCNEKLGGIWTWTGWSGGNRKEWDCLCTYPEIAGNVGCTHLNPNVCNLGVYNYDARTATRGPNPGDCKCTEPHYTKIITDTNVPLCIKKGDGYCPNDKVCHNFYSS
jgi:hypothetical protein